MSLPFLGKNIIHTVFENTNVSTVKISIMKRFPNLDLTEFSLMEPSNAINCVFN